MSIKRNKFGIPLTVSTVLAAATMLSGSMVYGQDVSKSLQIEVPVINLLKGNLDTGESRIDMAALDAFDQAFDLKLLTPAQPSVGKFAIESPVESLLIKGGDFSFDSFAMPNSLNLPNSAEKNLVKLPALDRYTSKRDIEIPTKQLINLGQIAEEVVTELEVAPLVESKAKPNNPSVEPGFINWHADLTTAALQSKISGKPVFHFQLLGQLDQRFT